MMIRVQYLLAVAAFLIVNNFCEIEAHGKLWDPVNRGSAFKKNFSTPENWNDDGNYCGGFTVHKQNKGKCGECGDNWVLPRPRPNENGGKYGRGVIVKTYHAGSEITVDIHITAFHEGFVEFALCPLKEKHDLETEDCFDKHKVQFADGTYKYKPTGRGHFYPRLRLPRGLTCEHCVLRWQYTAGNNWAICPDGRGRKGCGLQETFRTCSDITIQ
ncbi:uncharacterized protein [Venturia canescens]|uniref:uncharacterized protein n=1 Tax=Venturia canescens TaxID=32260 RepID=UPI001C9CDCBC|nr:uncharacterized protein LOC122416772 [Venturia canescens]